MSLSHDPRLRELAKQHCRELRKNQTNAEKIFWEAVRNRRFLGLKFNRQFPLYFEFDEKETFYIADFYCFEKKLIIELDGKIHDFQKNRDTLRTEIINSRGIVVIRFRNEEVLENWNRVAERLREALE